MTKIYDVEIFKNNISTLKETSKDNENNKYMTELEFEVVNFDKVKDEYIRKYKTATEIRSVDSLVCINDLDSFVEFKNGVISYYKNSEKDSDEISEHCLKKDILYDIDWKIRDSLLVFCDVLGETISYTRQNLDFILVYNEDKNKYRDDLKNAIFKKSNDELVKFGFKKYEIFFRKVHTYTEKSLNRYIKGDLI
ncbi:hypothetical protein [Parvimonas micra]|uniref:hypothetical protein n=1 Tax=Parvimonas micra TaxID=33033 RepID=UPI0022B6ABF1|nr:hypothetical protein [Parvimonas micra]WBB29705.1 hypothetical protein NM223_01450 [Parvimonas micra]